MASQAQRDAAARAVFVSSYANECEDDPEFPVRLWSQMSEESRSIYYRWADAALNAAAVTSDGSSP
jgi:hypothetical protein